MARKKINLVIPIAGKAQRFLDKGYTSPKPMIMVKDQMMIDLAMSSIKYDECQLIFVVRKDHIYTFSIDKILHKLQIFYLLTYKPMILNDFSVFSYHQAWAL